LEADHEDCSIISQGRTNVRIINADCMDYLPRLPDGSVDVIVTSPPYNLGVRYSKCNDRRPRKEFLSWCDLWLRQVARVLHPEGTFWLQIGDFAKNPTLTGDLRAIAYQYLVEQFEVIWAKSFPDHSGTQRGQFRPSQSPYHPDKHHEFVYFVYAQRQTSDRQVRRRSRTPTLRVQSGSLVA
jgi:site-specific DNA-methyltransferase (adenine-specific)